MIRINLMPVRISRRQEAVRNELIVVGAGLGVMLIVLGSIHIVTAGAAGDLESVNRKLKKDIEQTQEIVLEVEEAEKLKVDLLKKLDVIKRLRANKSGPVHMLDQISQATPEKLQLLSLDEDTRRVQLTGIAVSNEVISQFLSNLENSEHFSDVYLNAIDQVDQEGVKLKNFSITARLVVVGTEEIEEEEEEPAKGKKRKG